MQLGKFLAWLGVLIAALFLAGCAAAHVSSNAAVGGDISIVILRSDGKPAAGAVAAFVPGRHTAKIYDGRSIDDDPAYEKVFADEAGRIHLRPMAGKALLVVVDSHGCGQFDQQALADGQAVRLQEWGQIEGHLKIGSRPADCREIVAWQRDDRPYDPTDAHVLFLMETTTASNGWFAIYNVPPGKIGVGRSMMFEFPGGRGGGTTQKRFLEVQPGQTVHVALGGQGRPVIGRLLLTAEMKQKSNWQFGLCMAEHQIQTLLPMPEDVKNKPLGDRQAWYSHFMQTEEGKKYAVQQYRDELAAETYPLIVGADGSFRIEDVPAGTYTLHAEAWANAADAIRHRGDKLIEEDVRFTVPDIPGGRSDAPMNIGEVALSESVIASHTGEAAPAFTAKTVDGDDLRLSDFRGKYVLLDFWATWCGSCKNATADLKNIYDEFGKDGRLVVIGLSSDDLPYDPRKYAQDNGLSWRQCWIGADSSIAKMYGVDGIPSFWLIGPDGKVVMASGSVERVHAAVKAGMARF